MMEKRKIIERVRTLKNSDVAELINKRIKEFESFRYKNYEEWFKELCFCILTANSSAKLGIKIQKEIDRGFLTLSREDLSKKLREMGYRFYNKRAEYIVNARRYAEKLKEIVLKKPPKDAREWLVKNIKGIGYKEASHFLRNTGCKEVAIIDRHIMRVLGIKVGHLNRKRYMEIEKLLEDIAKTLDLTLAELDLYLWSMETGEVLK